MAVAESRILAYGDSLTWGSIPGSTERLGSAYRWPDVLSAGLGNAEVVSDGLRGRTTCYDEDLADCDRNGARTLPTTLYTHAPLKLVILMLGSNDMKPHIAGKAIAAMQGIKRLATIVARHQPGPGLDVPDVLIVSPPPLCETRDAFFADLFEGGLEESRKLAGWYKQVAGETGCRFFDAGSVCETSPIDGVHMDAENTKRLGEALVGIVGSMLKK